jgi:hypothetical protein
MRFPAQVVLILLVLALPVWFVAGQLGGPSEAHAATKEVAEAITVLKSDVAWNQRLLAAERLRKRGDSETIGELVKLTGISDVKTQALACATLGRIKSEASRGELKKLIKDTSADASLRVVALNALAGTGTIAERSWIESNVGSDPTLGGQVTALKKLGFWK